MKFITRSFRTSLIASSLLDAGFRNEANAEGAVVGAPEVKLTRAEKLAAQIATIEKRIVTDTAKVAELKQELETSERLSSVGVGTLITAKLGRAETTREVAAEVVGVKDDEAGRRLYKISFGEGFDADVQIIQPHQIVAITGQISQ